MFAETLSMGRIKTPEKIQEYHQTIIRESDRLTRFINKILDFQKIEKGQKIYSFDAVDIVEISKTASKIYVEQVHDQSLVMEQEYGENIPKIEIDEDAILQVILNLFLNAYKYSTHEKYTKIKIERLDDNIKISIIDHGVGIAKDELTKVFDRFYRVDVESTRTIKGSGIGLAFVKSVIDAHGGKIAVESNIDKGSIFYVLLPIKGRQ
jgi:signal transduction histidine kinase